MMRCPTCKSDLDTEDHADACPDAPDVTEIPESWSREPVEGPDEDGSYWWPCLACGALWDAPCDTCPLDELVYSPEIR